MGSDCLIILVLADMLTPYAKSENQRNHCTKFLKAKVVKYSKNVKKSSNFFLVYFPMWSEKNLVEFG